MTTREHPPPSPASLRALIDTIAPAPVPVELGLPLLSAVANALQAHHLRGEGVGLGPETITFGHDGTPGLDGPATSDPGYLAPEVAAGAPTPAGDAYGFAVLAHELLVGGRPRFVDGVPARIPDQHPDFPAYAGEAIARALGADTTKRATPAVLVALFDAVPADRWPTAGRRALPEVPQVPEPPEPPEPERPEGPDAREVGSGATVRERGASRGRARTPAWTPERVQQAVLVGAVLLLLALGALYAATRDDAPSYDPVLQGQGASRSLAQDPSPAERR